MIEEEQVKNVTSWLGTGSINIFGLPFSGKDTQAKRLAKMFSAPVIGGGDIIRSSNNEKVKQIIGEGRLAPIDDYLKIVTPIFDQPAFKGKPLILSSVGRWHGEETGIMSALKASGHNLKVVILLNINEKEVRNRWQQAKALGDRGRRADDAHGAIEVRLNEFKNKTMPAIQFYRDKGLLLEIDGKLSPNEVTNQILSELSKRASSF